LIMEEVCGGGWLIRLSVDPASSAHQVGVLRKNKGQREQQLRWPTEWRYYSTFVLVWEVIFVNSVPKGS